MATFAAMIDPALFRERLLSWHDRHPRPLPWKASDDPYLIWLSEIILQQTRVEQGLPYFERFREAFPTVRALSDASLDLVLKHWEGLGYYSRARNLHATARYISGELDGRFPDTYEAIKALKGIGPYTAAAIASFAFGLPHAVVDGNVYRVLARIFGIAEPIDSTEGKKIFARLAQELLDPNLPGEYNQAIMDFGATWCTPARPKCSGCPFRADCVAYSEQRIADLPVKSKRTTRRKRFFHYLVLECRGQVLLQQRREKDVWQHLFQFPLLEADRLYESEEEVREQPLWKQLTGDRSCQLRQVSKSFSQTLSHQQINAVFWEFDLPELPPLIDDTYLPVDRKNLRNFAFPKIIDWYLRDNSLYLKMLGKA